MQWMTIPDTGDRYEVSKSGLVRSRPRKIDSSRGGVPYQRTMPGKDLWVRLMRRKPTAPEYAFVYLRYPSGERKLRAVHAIVLLAFVGPREPWQQTRHINGDSLDNRLENLCWGTPEENRADMRRHGRIPTGEANGKTTLTSEDVLALRVMARRGMSTYQLAEWFNVSASAAGRIISGQSWPALVAALEAAP